VSVPSSPRQELRAHIEAKLAGDSPVPVIDRIMEMFYTVEDDWDRIDTSTFAGGGPGTRWLDQRFLVARVPVQSVRGERLTDRSVSQ
jgi:hypothetical protein